MTIGSAQPERRISRLLPLWERTWNGDYSGTGTHRKWSIYQSSTIRKLLKEGNVKDANHFLGYSYYLDGKVVNGYKVGRTLGFPTANLRPSCPDKLIPEEGVYAVHVYLKEQRFAGMLNIGHRPTLNKWQ